MSCFLNAEVVDPSVEVTIKPPSAPQTSVEEVRTVSNGHDWFLQLIESKAPVGKGRRWSACGTHLWRAGSRHDGGKGKFRFAGEERVKADAEEEDGEGESEL